MTTRPPAPQLAQTLLLAVALMGAAPAAKPSPLPVFHAPAFVDCLTSVADAMRETGFALDAMVRESDTAAREDWAANKAASRLADYHIDNADRIIGIAKAHGCGQ